MNLMSYQEVSEVLSKAGFAEPEIYRLYLLYHLHRNHKMDEQDQACIDPKRLGRLSEELPEVETAFQAPHTLE